MSDAHVSTTYELLEQLTARSIFFGSDYLHHSGGRGSGDDDEWEWKPQKQLPADYFLLSSDEGTDSESEVSSEVSSHAPR